MIYKISNRTVIFDMPVEKNLYAIQITSTEHTFNKFLRFFIFITSYFVEYILV